MEKYNRGSFEPGRFEASVCDRLLNIELSGDHILPDYLPEIKRILRVGAQCGMPSTYIGSDRAELSGVMHYDILYAGGDGELYSARLDDDYRFEAPFDRDSDADISGGVALLGDISFDGVVGRATGPRKISVKCRMKPRVRCYAPLELKESIDGLEDESTLRRLIGSGEYALVLRGRDESVPIADEVIPDGAIEDIRVIGAMGKVFVSEASAVRDAVICRGEAIIKLMICRDGGGEGSVIVRKIPFTREIAAEGAVGGNECRAWGEIGEINVTVGEGRIGCEGIMSLEYELQRPESFEYTRDIYSTEALCEVIKAEYSMPRSIRCMNGNFTQNGVFDQKENGIPVGSVIIDADGVAVCDKVSIEKGRGVMVGEVKYSIVFADEGEWGSRELSQPFRYEFDLPALTDCAGEPMYSVNLCLVGCRARLDGERIALDSEISTAIRLFCNAVIEAVGEVRIGDAEPTRRGECRICYPDSDDTLWSVSKRYRADAERMATVNSIRVDGSPDASDSLSGVRFVIVG